MLRADGVIATQMIGRADGEMLRRMHDQIEPLFDRGCGIYLVDTTQVPGFDPISLPPPARALLADIQARDVMVIAVISHMGVRMMGVTLCAAARVRFEAVETVERAEARVREILGARAHP